jgi:DNA-binding CsgD family transcriptional regulator
MKLYEQFINRVERFIPESYFQKEGESGNLENLLKNPQFEELLMHSPSVVGVFNNITMGYEFMSNNMEEILGHETSLFLRPGGMEKVLSTFKTEHAQIYNQHIFPLIFEYFQKCAKTKDIKKHRFTGVFQILRNDGNYIWCMQQIKVVSTDDNMYPILSLVFISDITDIKKDEDVDFVIACKDEEGSFKNVYVITIPSNSHATDFSKRELDILFHIKKGLSSKEIAEKLIISEHTVYNHRKNILKKYDGMNMMEIVQMMSNKKFI